VLQDFKELKDQQVQQGHKVLREGKALKVR
jgi:hypothetical protein